MVSEDNLLTQQDIAWVCSALRVRPEQVTRTEKNDSGLNNDTYILNVDGRRYFYRVPGFGTELFCDRQRECLAYRLCEPFRMTDEVAVFDVTSGRKLSLYYSGSHTVRTENLTELQAAMDLLRRFHALPLDFGTRDNHFDRLLRYEQFALGAGARFDADFYALKKEVLMLREPIEAIPLDFCPVHGDFLPDNVLIRPQAEPILLDLEFAAMGDRFEDLGTFCHHGDLRPEAVARLLRLYLLREPDAAERFKTFVFCATAGLMWYGWAMYKLATGGDRRIYQAFADRSLAYCAEMLPLAIKNEKEL